MKINGIVKKYSQLLNHYKMASFLSMTKTLVKAYLDGKNTPESCLDLSITEALWDYLDRDLISPTLYPTGEINMIHI